MGGGGCLSAEEGWKNYKSSALKHAIATAQDKSFQSAAGTWRKSKELHPLGTAFIYRGLLLSCWCSQGIGPRPSNKLCPVELVLGLVAVGSRRSRNGESPSWGLLTPWW